MDLIPEVKNLPKIDPEKVFIYGLMAIAMFIMVAKLNHVIEYCFVGLLVLWIGLKVKNRDFRFVRTPLDFPIIFFVAWVLVTIPFAVDPGYSFAEWRKTILQVLMFYFVVNVVSNETQVKKILLSFMTGLIFLSVLGIIEHFMKSDSMFNRNIRAESLTAAGQWFSSYLIMGIPFTWLFFRQNEGSLGKIFICGLFLIIITALFFSHTRGAWLALFVQIIFLCLIGVFNKWLRWDILKIVGFFVITCGIIFLGGKYNAENKNGVNQEPSFVNLDSSNIRLDTWQIAFNQILEKPIAGYGYGNHTFQKFNPKVMVGSSSNPSIGMHLHNVFLSMTYEVGFVGFSFFALVFLLLMKNAIRGIQELKRGLIGNLGLCVFLLVVGVVARNMFDNMFHGTLAYLFWLLTGLYFALRLRELNAGVRLR